MGKSRPSLPKSEMEVLRIVWNLGSATVRQVLDALPARRKLDFWTVQTYLRRLAAKGYLHKQRAGRSNVYSPAVQPKSVMREVLEDFVDRVFDGDAIPLLQHLIRDRGLSDDEIDQLQQALDELKTKQRKGPKR